MTLCEQCGSISIGRTPPELKDKLVTIFTGKRPFLCRRCGWRARRNWTDDDLKALADYGAGGAEPDPDMAALDVEGLRRVRRKAQNRGNRRKAKSKAKPVSDTFGFDALILTSSGGTDGDESAGPDVVSQQQPRRTRRGKPTVQREIVTAIAVATVVMLLVFGLSMTNGCGGFAG